MNMGANPVSVNDQCKDCRGRECDAYGMRNDYCVCPPKFRAGDHVHHGPCDEDWVLACDEENGEVICAGWPETFARASDCTLLEAAGDEKRAKMLRDVAKGCKDQYRGTRAKRQLEASS